VEDILCVAGVFDKAMQHGISQQRLELLEQASFHARSKSVVAKAHIALK
jgi:hypothetical protein